jgi:hypothetical protein
VSPIYLMTAGTYCFFGFSSPAIAGWLLPGLVLSLATMVFCYSSIACAVRAQAALVSSVNAPLQSHAVVRRSVWFVVVLLGGWGFAGVASVYELVVGVTPEWLVTAVGVGGVTHSPVMAITCLYLNAHHRRHVRLAFQGRWRDCWTHCWNAPAAAYRQDHDTTTSTAAAPAAGTMAITVHNSNKAPKPNTPRTSLPAPRPNPSATTHSAIIDMRSTPNPPPPRHLAPERQTLPNTRIIPISPLRQPSSTP